MKEIDDVVRRLDSIIAWARENRSPLGYFAALYRTVTVSVGEAITAGFFEDGPRMARLDAVFASHYIDAFAAWRDGGPVVRSWMSTFEQADRWSPIVLQHLLGGMNAHINLDLGIAAATVARGSDIADLETDFMRINAVLGSLVDETKRQLSEIWRPLSLLDRIAGPADDAVVDFSMGLARDGAWRFAERLAAADEAEWADMIAARDAVIGNTIADMVYRPVWPARLLLLIVRLGERGTVLQKLTTLTGAVTLAQRACRPTGIDRAAR